jgi:glycosyltransferase involved in cell wall biosynthesis
VKILFIHQYFKTPEEGGSIRSYYLAKGLVDAGHEVTMITARNQGYTKTMVDGIEVHYLNVPYDNSFSFLKRLWAFGQFVQKAKKEVQKTEKHDLAYVMTTPLTTGFIATYIKKELDIPYYFEVGDLWPEAPIKLGVIRNRLLKSWLYRLEKQFYFEAQKIIALSPAIRNYIEKVDPTAKVYVIPNMSDCSFFDANYSIGDYSELNKFQITYCGAIGKANHLDFLLDVAAESEKENLPVHFNIIGEGSEKKRLMQLSRRSKNISFYPHSNKGGVKNLLNTSDAVYVSFKDVDILGTGSPNKFFDSLASGKLTIINFPGWIKSVIEKNKCGFYHDPNSPEEFVRKVKRFIRSPQLLSSYQRNGRKLAELYYEKDIQITKLLKIINNEYKFEKSDSEVYILTA